jgi:hypothetical protein
LLGCTPVSGAVSGTEHMSMLTRACMQRMLRCHECMLVLEVAMSYHHGKAAPDERCENTSRCVARWLV